MITRSFNGSTVSYPGSWDEINFFQYQQLALGCESDAEVVSIITGMPLEAVRDSKDVKAFQEIVSDFSFYATPPKDFKIPESVVINGTEVAIPKDIGTHSVAQFEDLKAIIAELYPTPESEPTHNEVIEKYPLICAIYLQPLLDGEYGYSKANGLVKTIYMLPAVHVMGLGTFFFKKLIALLSGMGNASQMRPPIRRRKLLGFLK